MKKTFVIFILLSMLGCRSERINLTGKFDVVIDNKVMAVLTLKQEGSKLTGFFEWDYTVKSSKTVYAVTGTCLYYSKIKTATVQITIKKNIDKQTLYVLKGNATDSDSILGSLEQLPAATLRFASNKQSWMAIRKK